MGMEKLVVDRPYDMRRYARIRSSQPVFYMIRTIEPKKREWFSCEGQLLDSSEAGICIQTEHPLAPGRIVWFNGATEEKAGFIRWCRQLDSIYRIGIELDKLSIRKLDEATDEFMATLKRIDEQCARHEEDPDATLYNIRQAFDRVIAACEAFEKEINDRSIIPDAQIRFREKTDSILSKSYFINRTRTWPQGYQGDYKMLELIYRNISLSDGIGYYLDLCSLDAELSVAVRNRLKNLENILRDQLGKRVSASVLNIACGSCREVFNLAKEIENTGARFTCIDLDDDALSFAADRLSFTGISPLLSDQVELRKYNAIRMFDHELNMIEFGKQDIIYSVGFFDYLPSDFLANLFRSLYALLNPGGLLITSFKDANRYRHQEYHWIADWTGFLQRTEKDFLSIFHNADIPDAARSEFREESGRIIFYLVTK